MLLRGFARAARSGMNAWRWKIAPYLASLTSRGVSPTQAVFSWPETPADLGPRVVLFIHFDGSGKIQPFVHTYLEALHTAGLSIVFVSNAEKLRPEAIESLKPLCRGILVRRNVGYDFAAMREGLSHFGLPRDTTEMLIIANDSVYGPLHPIEDMLAKVDFTQADFWAATESWQTRYHLQSFFMIAGPRLLRHPAWHAFWNQVISVPNKHWVITKYEIGITQWMIRAGLRCAAIWPYEDLVRNVEPALLIAGDRSEPKDIDPLLIVRRNQARRIRLCYVNNTPLNPTSDMWRQLLMSGFPFLKRELLRENPTHVSDVIEWRSVVAETTQADISAIEHDLHRIIRNRAP